MNHSSNTQSFSSKINLSHATTLILNNGAEFNVRVSTPRVLSLIGVLLHFADKGENYTSFVSKTLCQEVIQYFYEQAALCTYIEDYNYFMSVYHDLKSMPL